MKPRVLLIEEPGRDANLCHDMIIGVGLEYEHATTLEDVVQTKGRFDVVVTSTINGQGQRIGPLAVSYLRRRNKPLVLALGNNHQDQWKRFNNVHYEEKFGNGVYMSTYRFRDFLKEHLGYEVCPEWS